ncbi:MAG TPA: hypothetical protein VK563_18350 [Puia sp.]|nr:hypothetical protein [Puia sp.]
MKHSILMVESDPDDRYLTAETFRSEEVEAGVEKSYSSGANSFIKKPDSYENTIFKIKTFINYWFATVELP